ncbi:MAG: serine/threonine-protein kinase [Armatimonadota bacterium]
MPQTEHMLGRYQIVREIARSNDIVYEAVDPTMNRRVAVKELALTESLVGTARRQRIERFYREARAAGAMSHPNIVTIYEVGEDNGRYFIAMEYLEGGTLREKLSLGGALPLAEALGIGIALCDALEYAHNHGIVHRDIKPDNVHLLPGGQVKLTDFGIARIAHEEQLTIAGQVFGTPSYMSPEQILGGKIDARTDIFSMGVLLYEMTTGRKPFTQPGDSVITITYRITNDPPPLPTGVPINVESAFARALSKDSAGRFASAAELKLALMAAKSNVSDILSTPFAAPARPDARYAPQATLQYGTQTQMGVAPGLSAAAYAPQGAPPSTVPSPSVMPAPGYPAGNSLSNEERSRRIGLTLVTLIIGIATLLVGGWGLSRAYQSYQGQMTIAQITNEYKAATVLYTSGKFEQAAAAFRRLRTASNSSSEIVTKATQGEVYSYRQLAHGAQDRSDFAAAVRWYQEAIKINPTDSQVQAELAAAQRRLPGENSSLANGSGPVDPQNPLASVIAPNPPPGASASPTPPIPLTLPSALPTISSSNYEASNAQAASNAAALFQQGEAAYRQGNGTAALRYWSAAVAAGPGTPAALQAQERISQTSNTTTPY